MKKLIIISLAFIIAEMSFGQTINIQAGTSISNLDWYIGENNIDAYNNTSIGFSGFIGIDYFNKKYFNISSNLGFLRKGGKEKVIETNAQREPVVERINKANLDYLSANTTLDIKYPVKDQLFPFISLGPRFDYLINHSQEFDGLKELDEQSQISYGFIFGGGIKYKISKIQAGIRGDYYLNLKKIAEWPAEPENLGGEISDKTFSINLIIGYILN